MNYWSVCLIALIVSGALLGQFTNALTGPHASTTVSGLPVTTLHTPATP